MAEHIVKDHQGHPPQCEVCDDTFDRLCSLKRHRNYADPWGNQEGSCRVCQRCGDKFNGETGLFRQEHERNCKGKVARQGEAEQMI